MSILKKVNSTKTNKKVTFSVHNKVYIIPSRTDLFNKGEIQKIRVGRFKVERIESKISKSKKRFFVELI